MAIITSYDARILVNSVDLSDHATKVTVNDGQETRDVSAMGNAYRVFRSGVGTPSIEVEFFNDRAASSIEATLRPLISISSTGFAIWARYSKTAATAATNPDYQMVGIIDGDLNLMDENHGEPSTMTVRFVPYNSFTVVTTSS